MYKKYNIFQSMYTQRKSSDKIKTPDFYKIICFTLNKYVLREL